MMNANVMNTIANKVLEARLENIKAEARSIVESEYYLQIKKSAEDGKFSVVVSKANNSRVATEIEKILIDEYEYSVSDVKDGIRICW